MQMPRLQRMLILFSMLIVGIVHAQSSTSFTYQGQLVGPEGPVDQTGVLAFFSLWSAPEGGVELASIGVPVLLNVSNGYFSTTIDFGSAVFSPHDEQQLDQGPWLQMRASIGINDPVEIIFPRQHITPVPVAMQTQGLVVESKFGLRVLPPNQKIERAGGLFVDDDGDVSITVWNRDLNMPIPQLTINQLGFVGIGTEDPLDTLHVSGMIRAQGVRLLGGADIAEPFEFQGEIIPLPGMVVSIDPDSSGSLRVADSAYDQRVAGVVSGAGGVNSGLVLSQEDTIADGSYEVALTGRVWCLVDADQSGPVSPGDLLTTSSRPGHAMRATDRDLAFGSTIGKAMTSLEEGQGLVLVLVNLH